MRKQRGFTLIELLIVVAIIGIIAAIAIPNLLDAIERAHQKRSIADINSVAGAIQSFATDMKGYPLFAQGDPFTNFGGATGNGWVSGGTVPGNVFIPDYIQAIPSSDGWSNPYQYLGAPARTVPLAADDPIGVQRAQHFALWSYGNDGASSAAGTDAGSAAGDTIANTWCVDPPVISGTNHTHCYMTDIVWADTSFLQAPEGKQKNCA